MSNVVEPLLFGHGTGVSSLALLMATVFWAFLWGPVGLLLAVPLTVCLVVLGEHIPSLGFLRTLLGDAPDVDSGALFFHRALVGDYDGAEVLIGELADAPLADVYGKVLMPALAQAKAERERGDLEREEEGRVYRGVRAVLKGALASRRPAVSAGNGPIVIGCAAQGIGDRIALGMLGDLVAEAGGELVVVPAAKLVEEVRVRTGKKGNITVCLVALAPGGLSRAARLSEQVRSAKATIVVGRWGKEADTVSAEKLLKSAGATQITWTLAETLSALLPAKPEVRKPEPNAPKKPVPVGAK
ncbi:AI-2E family transporter [Gemmata sp. G18]|uniref:AI-2E family transporter n=1 Tax=Gemmata palustris TaxID=2822762 RepID=A0ABS5BPI8_9BACT|nr:AI-2E family transporter [Gemmata palustris]MBP3955641.1 AI-2E family transporter [Gemmata palustris]